jgi:hypothetical protein
MLGWSQEGKSKDAANAGRNYSTHQWNVREVRLLALQALSGTSGAFRVSSILVTAASQMANAGRTTGSAPAARREVGCSSHSSAPRSGVAQIKCLAAFGRQKSGRMHVGLQVRAPASQGAGGRVFDALLPAKAGSSSVKVSQNLAARHGEGDECLSDYIGQWRFESARPLAGGRLSGINLVIPFYRVADAGGITGRRSPHVRVAERHEGSCPSFAYCEVAE